MNVPLRPQEVHDLVNRAGRLITSYVQEFLPDDNQIPSTTTVVDSTGLINRSLNDTTIRRPTKCFIEFVNANRSFKYLYITAHCQGMTFS